MAKKRKRERSAAPVALKEVEVKNVQDLKNLLQFNQTLNETTKQNLLGAEKFCHDIINNDEKTAARSNRILLEFVKSSINIDGDSQQSVPLDLFSLWDFAARTKNVDFLALAPAVLAALIEAISTNIDLVAHGARLCKEVLKSDHLPLLDRALSERQSHDRPAVIPCLKLLTQIVLFDGGSVARQVWRKRDVTFKDLDIFLTRRTQYSVTSADSQASSVRDLAVKFLLANLRLQDSDIRAEILNRSSTARRLFSDIQKDMPEQVKSILGCLQKLLKDEEVPRITKRQIINDWTLTSLAGLYNYESQALQNDSTLNIPTLSHETLLLACTSPVSGVLLPNKGWWPSDGEDEERDGEERSLPKEWRNHMCLYRTAPVPLKRVAVRNGMLSIFLQKLRPWGSEGQRELMVAIFKAAPELVADYVLQRSKTTFKHLSDEWMGFNALTFSIVQLEIADLPLFQENRVPHKPPPANVVIESLMPQILTKETLAWCMNQNDWAVRFIAARYVCLALQKLEKIKNAIQPADMFWTWKAFINDLQDLYCQRLPDFKTIVDTYKVALRKAEDSFSQKLRERLYITIGLISRLCPNLLNDEEFNLAPLLSEVLNDKQVIGNDQHTLENRLHRHEAITLLEASSYNLWIDWFEGVKGYTLSPFGIALRWLAYNNDDDDYRALCALKMVAEDESFLQNITKGSAFCVVVNSLRACSRREVKTNATIEFLDSCILRFRRQILKYEIDLEQILQETNAQGPVSRIMLVLVDQWPFWINRLPIADAQAVWSWLHLLSSALTEIGEARMVHHRLEETLKNATVKVHSLTLFQPPNANVLEIKQVAILLPEFRNQLVASKPFHTEEEHSNSEERVRLVMLEESRPAKEPSEYPALSKWNKLDVEEAITDGVVTELMSYLLSADESVRRSVVWSLEKFLSLLKTSTYSEREMCYLLLGEVIETVKPVLSSVGQISFTVTMAIHFLRVIQDPLHFLYEKVCSFLCSRPQWSTLLRYWVNDLLVNSSSTIEKYWTEKEWFIDVVFAAIRIFSDVRTCHHVGILQHLLLFLTSTKTPHGIWRKTQRIFWRCTFLEGGSDLLITKCGITHLMQMQSMSQKSRASYCTALTRRVLETCDSTRADTFSFGTIQDVLDIALEKIPDDIAVIE